MPVSSHHAEYDRVARQWQRCRDAIGGSDAIKDAASQYLPALSGQTAEEYDGYKARALWYGASARTVQGLTGSVMRKDPTFEVPEALKPFLSDITSTGVPIQAFTKSLVQDVLAVGRCGVLVDLPKTGAASRPYWVSYCAEQIINWGTRVVNGVNILSLVVLQECLQTPHPTDRFTFQPTKGYRVLTLNEDGHYVVELYSTENGVPDEVITPTFKGRPFDYIPFCFFGPTSITPDIEKPPILDLVDVNLSHYRSSADLEHGRHFCGLPTPWVAGFPEKTHLEIGSAVAWVASDPNAKAGMLEFTGQGLQALEKALESKERLMAVLGARLLEEQKKAVEAADTLQTRYAGEQSVLRSVAGTIGSGLSQLLKWTGLWMGLSPTIAQDATAKLNTDFMDTQMSFTELESLVRTWQAGAISYETLYYNMERGEVSRPGIDWETEREQIDTEAPGLLPDPDRPTVS